MIINHNLMAMNTHRQLGVNQANSSKSMERLSSGMRINRAGDDAAGLAISEKMRGQIRGLKQAQRNAQDGISLIQTAEGALNETHSILQRMRELATQAATDTNTLTDRKEIQKEINQLLDEIDRIADKTTFNTQEILDGTYEGKIFHIGANEGDNMEISIGSMKTDALGGGTAVGGATPGGEAGNAVGTGTIAGVEVTITGGTDEAYDGVEVVFTTGSTAGAAWVGNTLTVTLDETSDADAVNTLIDNATGTAPIGVDTLTVAFDGDIDGAGSVSGSVTLATPPAAPFTGTVMIEDTEITVTGGTDAAYDGVEVVFTTGDAAGAAWVGKTLTVTLDETSGAIDADAVNALIENAADTAPTGVDTLTVAFTGEIDASGTVSGTITLATPPAAPATGTVTIQGTEITVTGGTDEAYDGVEVVFTTGSTAGAAWVDNVLTVTLDENKTDYEASDINTLIDNATGTVPTDVDTLTVAFTGEIDASGTVSGTITLAADGAGASIASLKVDDVDSVTEADVTNGTAGGVLTQDGANKAITNINDAIEQVSAERSKLGAIQNRLEHTIANLGTSAENLQAAESRIRDLDMAEEIMAFTKNNILQQAATAMLAQANMAPQSVLQLLG